jgi:hypothetical protein
MALLAMPGHGHRMAVRASLGSPAFRWSRPVFVSGRSPPYGAWIVCLSLSHGFRLGYNLSPAKAGFHRHGYLELALAARHWSLAGRGSGDIRWLIAQDVGKSWRKALGPRSWREKILGDRPRSVAPDGDWIVCLPLSHGFRTVFEREPLSVTY